jgi:hypothetical protein
MRVKRKILAIALLLSVATTLLGATTLQSLVHSQPPAACHEHSHPAHSPAPVNHLCCGAGHQTAILQKCATIGYSLNCVSLVSDGSQRLNGIDSSHSFSSGIVLPGSPPAKIPLRV